MDACRIQSRNAMCSIAVAIGLSLSTPYAGFAQKGGAGGEFGDLHRATWWHSAANDPSFSHEIEQFLRDCKKRFDKLWTHFGEAEKQRRMLADSSLTEDQQQRVQEGYRKHLKRVARSAGGLRSRMMPLLRGFEDKKDLEWTPSWHPPFKSEMEFIRKYIREAEARFDGRQSQVVHYGDENILVCLYWVQQMAKRVREELEL